MPISEVKQMDCMEYMAGFTDRFFDLAIIDPPYGKGEDGASNHRRGGKVMFGDKFGKNGSVVPPKKYTPKNWDSKPPDESYFKELFRVSKNQIIFGANHFISRIPYDSSCWIVWDKRNAGTDFADCELAWTSFPSAVRMLSWKWNGMLQQDMKNKEDRIHPTQKPKALYRWLLDNYAKPGDKILDTHLGSGSSRIAAYEMDFDFYACENDAEYFAAQEKRFREQTAQQFLF